MHECINVGAFFNESGTEVGTLLRLYFAHDVEEHIEEHIGIGDLTCFAHQAHNLIHTPGKGNHLEDRRTNVPDLLNLFDSLLESISCLLIPYRRLWLKKLRLLLFSLLKDLSTNFYLINAHPTAQLRSVYLFNYLYDLADVTIAVN